MSTDPTCTSTPADQAFHVEQGVSKDGVTEVGQETQASHVEQQAVTVIGEDGEPVLMTYIRPSSEMVEQQQLQVVTADRQESMASQWTVEDATEEQPASTTAQLVLASTGDGLLADTSSLQSLLSSGAAHLTTATGKPVQIVTVAAGPAQAGGKVWQVVSPAGQQGVHGTPTLVLADTSEQQQDTDKKGTIETIDLQSGLVALPEHISSLLIPPSAQSAATSLPANSPSWAARLRDCQRIGDAYRGWVENEIELDLLLTFHKGQTQSFWGTRQSPSPAKRSTRLMWKSQYVPFDGIPFVNAGSRAIVMECQFGPRRKGSHVKKIGDQVVKEEFRQTCPARIYIKKVCKFVECAVNLNQDKKSLKAAMDRAFQTLRERGFENDGQERYYVQLPTEEGHEFHSSIDQSSVPLAPRQEAPQRLDPRVAAKIREIVGAGEPRLYAVRKALRLFVEKELFIDQVTAPERHNLSFFPTVNDLQNHIHQAMKDIEDGLLPITAQTVNVEVVTSADNPASANTDLHSAFWETTETEAADSDSPHAETVTVTLTHNPSQDGQHIISRVETHLSDGSTQIRTTLTEETARLLAKLHPNMFPSTDPGPLQDDGQQPVTIINQSTSGTEDIHLTCQLIDGSSEQPIDTTGATELEPMEVSMDTDEDVVKVEETQSITTIVESNDNSGLAEEN